MKKGLLIVVEGTDCSGKETQSNLLVKKLNDMGIPTEKYCFPRYNSATGKIIAGPYLGKEGYYAPLFEEGAVNVSPYVASLYYAADRKYNIKDITDNLEKGVCMVVDRYVESNFAHQGSKFSDVGEQEKMFEFLDNLEYGLLQLPKPDVTLFLHMPTESAKILKQNREEKPDLHEIDENYLKHCENTYLRLAEKRGYKKVSCVEKNNIKTIEQIHSEVVEIVVKEIEKANS